MMGATSASGGATQCLPTWISARNGAGDLGVSKRVRVMTRLSWAALACVRRSTVRTELAEALERNLLRGAESPDARQADWLTVYWHGGGPGLLMPGDTDGKLAWHVSATVINWPKAGRGTLRADLSSGLHVDRFASGKTWSCPSTNTGGNCSASGNLILS